MPDSLPSGFPAQSMLLYATSCSSTSFCLSVGTVFDTQHNAFPLVETYSAGAWSPSVAALPANADNPQDFLGAWDGVLYSVSCPIDGQCAAVGDYVDAGGLQSALLDNLSAGVWSATEGALPPVSGQLVNINAVSCPTSTSCTAVGDDAAAGSVWVGLLYEWSESGWQLEPMPLPSAFYNNLNVYGIACADVSDCVAVGYYGDALGDDYGLILTLSNGGLECGRRSLAGERSDRSRRYPECRAHRGRLSSA